jgi:hypothetical protein
MGKSMDKPSHRRAPKLRPFIVSADDLSSLLLDGQMWDKTSRGKLGEKEGKGALNQV